MSAVTSAERPIKVAFGSVPKDGGTFTFYRNIRAPLAKRGVDMQCVALGKRQAALWEDDYADDGCVLLAENSHNLKTHAKVFVDWCRKQQIDVVMAINSEGILSALPHLPPEIRVVSRCANAFDHGYRITMSGQERLSRIVALVPRLATDLKQDYGADPASLVLIPNGIEPAPFAEAAATKRGTGARVELGFLGRLEHGQKGVMHLVDVVKGLSDRGVAFRLRIAGKGVDRERLEAQLAPWRSTGEVEFLGALGPKEIPAFLAQTDIFVFTSHFEGCPNALLEAMTAGAVPVSWIIEGITDFLLDDGKTGYLCKMGDTGAMADRIAALSADRGKLQLLSQAVADEASSRFTNEIAADAYASMLREVMAEPPMVEAAEPWSAFKGDPNFPNYWRESIPRGLRHVLAAMSRKWSARNA